MLSLLSVNKLQISVTNYKIYLSCLEINHELSTVFLGFSLVELVLVQFFKFQDSQFLFPCLNAVGPVQ